MSDFKDVSADSVTIRNPATDPTHAVRLGELDEALAVKADQTFVENALANANHLPATGSPGSTVQVNVDPNQVIGAEVKIPDEVIIQEAEAGVVKELDHPVQADDEYTLDRVAVSIISISRADAAGNELAVGVENTDFVIVRHTGKLTIVPGSNLITAISQKVIVNYDVAQVKDGPALQSTDGGLAVKLGVSHEAAARGDHIHDNDHRAASANPTEGSLEIAVDEAQRISGNVKLDGPTLQQSADGVKVNTDEIAVKDHEHDPVDGSNPGFMTPPMLAALESAAANVGTSVESTDTIDLTRSSEGKITADARLGSGLDSDQNGIKIDYNAVAAKNHVHPTVTGIASIFVNNPGGGYTYADVTVDGGDGTGCTAAAVIEDGEITAINVVTGGWGWTIGSEPTVTIVGDGVDAEAVANLQTDPGFMDKEMVEELKAHEARLTADEATLATHTSQIATLEMEKADLDYVNTQLDLKSNVGHTHVIADITGLQAALDGKADVNHTHPIVTDEDPGFMSPDMKQELGCLSNLLQEEQQARLIMPTLRVESPSLGGTACAQTIATEQIDVGGVVDQLYTLKVRVRGKVELKVYTAGTADGFVNTDGVPAATPHNIWKVIISDPPATVYLNTAHDSYGAPGLINLDYEFNISVRGGATVSLAMDSIDALQNVGTLGAIVGVAPYPEEYNGQFLQVDPIKIVGECLYETLFGDGPNSTIVTIGGGDPGNNENIDGQGNNELHTIEVVSEFHRLELINAGGFDDDVYEIRIIGDWVWVGGKFINYNASRVFGLAKISMRGNLDPFFQPGSGFSQPIRYIRPLPDGGIVAGGILDSLFRASGIARPLWKVSTIGKRDDTFVCPPVLNEVSGTAYGQDVLIGVAVLQSGKLVVLSEQVLTVLNLDGTVFYQATGNARFNWILEHGNKILLSSYAYASAGVAQTYNTIALPKGLKLLNMGDDWELNLACIGDFQDGAGTEAVATQMKAVKPDAILLLGDDNYDFGDASTIDANIGKYFRKFIYPYKGTQALRAGEHDAITNQCWPVPGNHDWGNILTARGRTNINPDAEIGDLDYQNVTGLNLTFPGSGYTYPPIVTIAPPDLSGTTATAIAHRQATDLSGGLRVKNARIIKVDVNNGGTGYAPGTTLVFQNYPGDGGSGATIVPTIVAGVITAITITNAGAGYDNTPLIKILNAGGGTGATFTVRRGSGTGYVTAPLVSVASPSGSGAAFTALILLGAVYSFHKTSGGAGYVDETDIVVTFDNSGTGGAGAQAVGFLLGAPLVGLEITDPGAGYTTKPAVTIVGGGHEHYTLDTDPDSGTATFIGGREASLQAYLDYFTLPDNERYYKLSLGDVDLFFLDTDKNEPDGITVGSDQYNWFIEQVGNSTARWKGVIGHHVPKSSRPNYAASNGWMDAWNFATLGVDFFIGGHSHTMEHIQEGTFDYFISGNGGKDLLPYGTPVAGSVDASRINDKFGFAQLKIRQNSLTVNFIDQDGALRYSYTKTKQATSGIGGFGDIDQIWALNQNAGTGAMSACGVSVPAPDGSYFVVGNSLLNFNSPNTSWNANQLGNLLLWSEQFQRSVWVKVGAAPLVVEDFANNPSNSEMTADKIQDIDAVSGAYIYQDVALPGDASRYEFSLNLKRDGDSSRFVLLRLEFTGGTGATNDCYCYVRTDASFLFSAAGIGGTTGVAALGAITEAVGSDWMRMRLQFNNNGHTNLRCYIYPAYSDTFGSPSEAITGSTVIWGAQLRKTDWTFGYLKTEGASSVPGNDNDNSDRFRGLYKIKENGDDDPNFAVHITLNAADAVKYVIPYGIDSQERIYFGGPVTSVNGTTVAPWLLYRVLKDGTYDKTFNLFNDKVLVARVGNCDQIIVGGKFTAYGSRKCGRIVWLNPDGTIIEDSEDDRLPIFSETPPDVIEHPCYKRRLWVNTGVNPMMLNMYNDALNVWQSICEVCAATIVDKLPPPIFNPPGGNAPVSCEISVPGYPNATIHYTLDGSDPTILSPIYRNPISITVETTVKAFAVQLGFTNSDISEVTYYDPSYQQCEPVTFDAPSGSPIPCNVVLSTLTPSATIYWEWGSPPSEPTTGSAVYTGPINVGVVGSIRAFAVKGGYHDSIKTQADYVAPFRLLNFQFRPTGQTDKTGAAATGSGGDFWNKIPLGVTVFNDAFHYADNATIGVDLAITGDSPGVTTFNSDVSAGTADAMWKSYMDLVDGTSARYPFALKFTQIPNGTYDIYIYTGRARLQLNPSTGTDFGIKSVTPGLTGLNPPGWMEGQEYVAYRNVVITDQDELAISILLNGSGSPDSSGALHGIQFVQATPTQAPQIKPVTFAPPSGSVAGTITLRTLTIDPTLKIYYTLDGSDPTTGSSFVANGGTVAVTSGHTITAFAVATGWSDSIITSATYGSNPQFPPFKCTGLEGIMFSNIGTNQFGVEISVDTFAYGHTMAMNSGSPPIGATFTLISVQLNVVAPTNFPPTVQIASGSDRTLVVSAARNSSLYYVYATIRGSAPGYTDRTIQVTGRINIP